MSNDITDILQGIIDKKPVDIKTSLNNVMLGKISDLVDQKKDQVAHDVFGIAQEEQQESDDEDLEDFDPEDFEDDEEDSEFDDEDLGDEDNDDENS